jgi:tripartite-type tricarboxylate transporter receptor subunit TctC
MMKNNILARRRLVACALLATLPLDSIAQDAFPNRPITLIVPFAPGNVTDSIARMIGDRLASVLGQPVVIENKAGASGAIGMLDTVRAPADGYTLGMSAIGPMALNPALYRKLSYDPYNDVSVLSLVYKGPSLILVLSDSPIATMADLIQLSKTQGGGLDYATAGIGSSMHLTGELLKSTFGANLRHVPNRGSGAAALLLLGKEVPVLIDSATAGLNSVRTGKMRALAVTSSRRLKALPDVPTLAEAGFPGVVVDGWLCVVTPNGVPPLVRQRLADALRKVMQEPALGDKISALGGVAVSASEGESVAFVRTEQKRWADLIHMAGIRLD